MPDLQRFGINPEGDLPPGSSFRAAMLARLPLALAFHLDAGAVQEQVQLLIGTAIWNGYLQGLLATLQRAAVLHEPAKPG